MRACVTNILCLGNSLTWNGSSLCIAANFRSCWPHARSQLPHFRPLTQPPLLPLFPHVPLTHASSITQTTWACPNLLLLGTKIAIPLVSHSHRIFIYIFSFWPTRNKKQDFPHCSIPLPKNQGPALSQEILDGLLKNSLSYDFLSL
jgi:hypothetical protein